MNTRDPFPHPSGSSGSRRPCDARGAARPYAACAVAWAILAAASLAPAQTPPAQSGRIFVPYEDLSAIVDPAAKSVLMERAAFEKLLEAAKASQLGQSIQLGQVAAARYTASVSGDRLSLNGELTVLSLSDLPVTVPLRLGQLSVTQILLDGQPAPLGYDRGQLVLITTGRGTHKLTMTASALLREMSGGGMQFTVTLPSSVAGSMKLSAPGDLSVHSTVPSGKEQYDRGADRTTVNLTVGGHETLSVALTGNGRQEDLRAILLGESATRVELTGMHQVLSCVYTTQVLRRGTAELQFHLDRQWTVTDVSCPNLIRWAVQPAGEKQQLLTIRLRDAARGTQALHIQATAPRNTQTGWSAPRINLVGAAFQRGYLIVDAGANLLVRGQKLTDARREDPSAAAAADFLAPGGGRMYYHWGDRWSIQLDLVEVNLRRLSDDRQHLLVTPRLITLDGQFIVTAVGRETFEMGFVLPGDGLRWDLWQLRVNDEETGFEYRLAESAGQRTLTIELARPIPPEGSANVNIVLRATPAWDFEKDRRSHALALGLIQPVMDAVSGVVAVSSQDLSAGPGAPQDLDAEVTKAPPMLKGVNVGRMASLDLGPQVQTAYTYDSPVKGAIELQVRPRTARLTAQSVALATVRPDNLAGDWLITYDVSQARTQTLHLLVDKSLGQAIDIDVPGQRLNSRRLVQPPPADLPKGYDLWQLDLDAQVFGPVQVRVHYDRPLPGGEFDLPLVRPYAPQSAEVLAVQASEEQAVTVSGRCVSEIDTVDLPALPATPTRLLSALRLESPSTARGAGACVRLQTQKHNPYAIPPAVAARAAFTTYLGPDGSQRTEATYHIANAALQFLTVGLEKDAQLWSASIAGQSVKPKRDNAGNLLLALPRSDTPIPVQLVYFWAPPRRPDGMVRLGRVTLGDRTGQGGREVKVNFLSWQVVPPPGMHVVKQRQRHRLIYVERTEPAFLTLADALKSTLMSLESSKASPAAFRLDPGLPAPDAPAGQAKETMPDLTDEQSETADKKAPKPVEPKSATETTPQGREPTKPPVGEGKPATQPPANAGLGLEGMMEGWHTLPIELKPTPMGGPALSVDSLAAAEYISVGLAGQNDGWSWGLIGLAAIAIFGLILHRARAWVKFNLIFLTIVLSSLLALWVPVAWPVSMPMLVHLLNGAFWGACLLIPAYLLTGLVRKVWQKIRPAAAGAGLATALVLLAVVLTAAAPSSAAEPSKPSARPGPAGTPALDPEIEAAIRREEQLLQATTQPIVVPYTGEATKADQADKVLVPYARFVQLWNQAHPDQPLDLPTPAGGLSLASVRYAATVSDQKMDVVLTAQVRTYGQGYVTLPMPLGGLAVTEATIDGKPAKLQVGPKGMILTLEGGLSGTLKLVAATTPKYVGRRGSVELTLPPLPGAVMTVLLPQDDLVLEAHGIEGGLDRRNVQGGVEWTLGLGDKGRLSLTWAPKAGGGTADRTLASAADHNVYFFHWALVGVSKFTFTFSAADYDRFTLLVPDSATLTDLSGANLRDYRSVGEQTVDGAKFRVIEARLHRPAVRKYELTARWMGELPPLDAAAPLPLVQSGDVARESGSVTLHAAGGMTVKVPQVVGGRKSSTSSFSAATAAGLTQMVAQYVWPYRPFSLQVQIARQSVRPSVRMDQLVRVGAEQVQLLTRAQVTSPSERVFSASFALPDGYELLSAVGPAVDDTYVQPVPTGRRLHVNFREGVQNTQVSLVLVKRGPRLDRLDVPFLAALDEAGQPIEQRGRLAVQVEASLAAHTIGSENLKPIVPQATANWLEDKQVEAVRFAYEYETPKISLALQIARQETKVRVEVVAGMSLSHAEAAYAYRLRYSIEGSPIDRVRFSLPARYAPLVTVTSNALRGLTRTDEKDRSTWTVTLVNEVIGDLDVMVNFSIPVDAETDLEVPTIQTDAPAGYVAIVAVQNFSSHELTVAETRKLADLPAAEQDKLLSSQVRQSLQYVMKSLWPDWSMRLRLTPAKAASRIQVVIDLLAMTTVIDRSGHLRHEARLELQNRSEQFLRVRLTGRNEKGVAIPLPLWSAEVAGQPVRPVQAAGAAAGDVLIPMVKTSPGGLPYEVRLYFSGEALGSLGAISRIQPPTLAVGAEDPQDPAKPKPIPVIRTTWSLLLPEGYTYVQRGGNMSPAVEQAELMSVAIDARLEQLQRLKKGYSDTVLSSRSRGIATRNWVDFNEQIAGEIRQAEEYVEKNKARMGEQYGRIKQKLSEQSNVQYGLMGGWVKEAREQEQRQQGDVTNFLNVSGVNPGLRVRDIDRNRAMNALPEFVQKAAQAQQESLEKEIQKLQVQQQATTQPAKTAAPKAGDLLTEDEVKSKSAILKDLEGEKTRQMAKRQEEVQQQIEQIAGPNRLNRYYNQPAQQDQAQQGQPQAQPQAGPQGMGRGVGSSVAPPPPPRPTGRTGRTGGGEGENLDDSRRGAADRYVPPARYSLPLELPQGQIRKDFTHPSGDASLVLYAIRNDLVQSAYATAAILGLLVVVYLGRYIYRYLRRV